VDRTAQRTGLTARGVQRAIRALLSDGLLVTIKIGGGRHHTNEYRIDIHKLSQLTNQSNYKNSEPRSPIPWKGEPQSPFLEKGEPQSQKGEPSQRVNHVTESLGSLKNHH
jgi:hypothetical protein